MQKGQFDAELSKAMLDAGSMKSAYDKLSVDTIEQVCTLIVVLMAEIMHFDVLFLIHLVPLCTTEEPV